MQLTRREFDGVSLVDLRGALDLAATDDLRRLIRGLSAAGQHQIVLNLRDVNVLCDSAIEPLVSAAREVAGRGGEIKLAAIEECLTEPLNIARLHTVFDIAEDDATAVCDFAMPAR